MSVDLHSLSFRTIVDQLGAGELTAGLVFEHFARRAAQNSSLNAFTQLGEKPQHDLIGPLYGAPIAVKDNIDVAGFCTTGGTPALQKFHVTRDAPLIETLRSRGAAFLGKTNLHELSFGITSINQCTGPVRNPHNPHLFAGGSSGGSAAAVAAGLAPIALGSDTGGSCRIPAALCGVIGYRPSTGRYDNTGVIPLSTTRDTIGIIAREIDDIAFLDATIVDEPNTMPVTGKPVLGVPDDASLEPLDCDVGSAFRRYVAELTSTGIPIEYISLAEIRDLTREVSRAQIAFEAPVGVSEFLLRHRSRISVDDLFDQVAGEQEKAFLKGMLNERDGHVKRYDAICNETLPALKSAYSEIFKRTGINAILQPTTSHVAQPIENGELMKIGDKLRPVFPEFTRFTDPASCAGLACLSFPLQTNGLPVGVELQAPHGADHSLFAIARHFCGGTRPLETYK